MPSVIAHMWYGDVACHSIADDKLRTAIRKYHGAYLLGCQGPDIFYYYHRWPWSSHRRCKKVYGFGNALHYTHINEGIGLLLKEARKNQDELLTAYTAGYVSHWCMDTVCHPYVYYETDSLQHDTGYAHQLFEAQIDRGILDVKNAGAEDFKIYRLVRHPKELAGKVYGAFRHLFEDMEFRDVADSFRNFVSMHRFIYDPNGKKYNMIAALENFFGLKGVATSVMTPQSYDSKEDALNLRKDQWFDPCDRQPSNASFEELAQKAVGMMNELFSLLAEYLDGKCEIDKILDMVGNRSFTTGKSGGEKMKYFKRDMKNGV